MTTAGGEEADAGRRRVPPAAIAAVVMVGAVVVLGLKNWFEGRAETRARAEESRREMELYAAMARDVAERERRRPAPASGVRLVPRSLVRVGDDHTSQVRTLGWSPDGKRFAVIRQDHFGILGIERDVYRETAVIFDVDGRLLREVPLPPIDRFGLNRDARFALTSAGHVVVEGGEARLFGLDGRETGRIGGGARGPIVGVCVDPRGMVVAWTSQAVVLPDEPGGPGTRIIPVDIDNREIRGSVVASSGKSAILLAGTPERYGTDAYVLELGTGRTFRIPDTRSPLALNGRADHAMWFPGSDRILLTCMQWNGGALGFEVATPDGAVETSVKDVTDAALLPDGNTIAGHCKDGALRLWNRDGSLIRCVPAVLYGGWYVQWWREPIVALMVPPKGDFFATLRNVDGEYLRLWSAAGEPLAQDPMPGTTLLAHFSPSGERVLVGYASWLVAVLEIERDAAGK